MKPFSGISHFSYFLPHQPTFTFFLRGPFFFFFFDQLRGKILAATTIHTKAVQVSFETPMVPIYLGILTTIAWFQDCIMRRIRRSAVGSPERENGARSAFCDSSLCATSGRTIKVLSQTTRITRKSRGYSSSLPTFWPPSFFTSLNTFISGHCRC